MEIGMESEMKIRKAVCLLYFDTTGEVLSVKRLKTNNYGLPGGKVDKGETPKDALVREIKEETNLNLDKKQLIPIYAAFVNGFYCTTFITLQTYLNLDDLKQMEKHIKPVFVNSKILKYDSDFSDYNVGVFNSYRGYKDLLIDHEEYLDMLEESEVH